VETGTSAVRGSVRLYPDGLHHPRIVPPEYFRRIEVIEGGVGAGTRTRVTMRVLGRTREFEHIITEPEPGRVLVEADVDGSSTTSFIVDGGDGTDSTRLTISTELVSRSGVAGALERVLSSTLLRRIYRKELARTAEYVSQL
jgi:hypothetical protein